MSVKGFRKWLSDTLAVIRGALRFLFVKAREARVDTIRRFFWLRTHSTIKAPGKIRGQMRGKSAQIWWDKHAFDRILFLLSRAKFSIMIQIFIWKTDETGRLVASILLKAADRGVKIRITKEAVGDVFEYSQGFIGSKESDDPLWKKFWNHPNILITHRTDQSHSKVFVIDESLLLLTGMNIADEYRFTWHDYLVELRGARFVESYLLQENTRDRQVHLILNKHSLKAIRPAVMKLLHSAKESIFLEQAYLSDPEVVDLLIKKSHQHVDVVVILPGSADIHQQANMDAANHLLKEAAKGHIGIFLYPGMVHGKVILVDRFRAIVGSANLIKSSLDEMDEACVLLDGKPAGELLKLNGILLKDMLKSHSMDRPQSFSFMRKILAWIGL